ncbi:hypothetical protein [Pseudomonas synxantha]|uniref:hypothetical protein n=1 Tax=Pseudomonas synxantha TaxID=47883 RepID=UPI000F577871|nr:hypothetical protein [Pseudomonas synxantha]
MRKLQFVNLGGKPVIRTLGTLLTFAGFQDLYAKRTLAGALKACGVSLFETIYKAGKAHSTWGVF